MFITANIFPNQYSNPEKAIDDALQALNTPYIDLMMVHHPGRNDVSVYKALEQAVQDGKVRSIGLANWYIKELEEFLPQVTVTPALIQNEIHPYYQEPEVIPYIQNLGIAVSGWHPFGGSGHTAEVLGDKVITAIAETHHVTPRQVIIRWNLQRGVICIPSRSDPENIKSSLDVFGFELSETEMQQINGLNRDEKHDVY